MRIDIKNVYSCAPMDRYELMIMKKTDLTKHVQQEYNLQAQYKDGYVYIEIWSSIYSLPQGGKLAQE